MINIKRASTTHTVLMYLRMKDRKPSTKESIYKFSPDRFDAPYVVQRSLDVLIRQQFAICKNEQYTITSQGKDALRFITAQQPVERYNDKSSII